MSVEAKTEYVPGDPILIRDIISQLKSQGVFDQFRKECISDVDTKPAYQNLCHRVDGQVSSYLSDIRWGPDLNKNQLRENIRKFVNKIVDQLVNPRINTVLVPKVEDIVYQYVGIPPVERPLPAEFSHDSNGNHKFDSQDSSFEKSWSSSSSYKRNYENELSWSRSPSKKFDNYVHSKMDSSSSLPSLFDLKIEPPDEIKEKNESRIDLFHSEGGEDENSRAYSTIDSDEDNLNDDTEEPSPSFETFDLPDVYNSASADSDYPVEAANLENDSVPGLDIDVKSEPSNVEHNDENVNTDSLDDHSSQIGDKVSEETAPAQFDVPKTPTINYETSEDSDDNCLKANEALKEVSVDPEHGSLADDIPDFSSVDKIAQKIAEDNCDQEKITFGSEEVVLKNGNSDRQQTVVESTPKPKEDETEKHHKDGEKESKAADSNAKDSKHRDRKYSDHRKDKHKSDKRDNSRDDRERKHREKERPNHSSSKSKSSKSRTESRDKTRKSSDEKEPVEDDASNKSKSKDDHKSHRSHDDRKSRDKDEKKQKSSSSSERRSKDGKSKEKRSRSDDGKEDRKKSRHDQSKDPKQRVQEEEKVKLKKLDVAEIKDTKKNFVEDEKLRLRKSESGESKKSGKSQCGTDEKKVRTDRRSSDRDSNGPSSSSNHTHHHSSSKSDKEKHSDKSRHSSSLSSTSHKSKKSDNTKSVSSDHLPQDGCENSDVSKHHKELAHREKKKEDKSSVRTTGDHRDMEQISKDPSAASDLFAKGQDAKFKEHFHHEKKKEEKASSRIPTDCVDAEQLLKEPFEAADLESKRQEEAKNLKISSHLCPTKRSLVEMNSKAMTSVSDELPSDCQNSPLKISDSNLSALNIKKPKIARNEFEFGKVMRLRKEYKERMRLLQQQGKENNSESCPQTEEKRIIDRISPVPTLKEPKVVSNGNKNGLIKDLKLSITRIDACYKIIDGSCFVKEVDSTDDDVSQVEVSEILPEADASVLKLNVKSVDDEKQEKLKLKICRSISPTSGKKRTKCVQSMTCENEESKSNPTRESGEIQPPSVFENEEIATNPVCENEKTTNPVSRNDESAKNRVLAIEIEEEPVFYPPSENDDDLEEEPLNDEDLLRQMNIEEIIGCRTDCTRISYDSDLNSEKNAAKVDEAAKEQVSDKNSILFDEDNKENVGTKTRCVNDVTVNNASKRSSPDVHYFEPSSPTTDFSKFVKKLIRDSEDVSLLNFSIELAYPQECDAIFRSQLGATVNRVVEVGHFPSTNSASTSTISSSIVELPEVKEMLQSDVATNELKPITEFSSLFPESKCSSHADQLVAPVQKVKVANTSKRKTLGIKRRISSVSGSTVCSTLDASTDLPAESSLVSRVLNPASAVAENNAKKKSPEIPAALSVERSCLNTSSQEFLNAPEINCPRLPTAAEHDETKRIYSSFNNNVPESSSYPISAKTSKKPRKNSPLRGNDEILTEIVPKRTPYKNKCYYDSSDLYKPRPSFLASSRRSRALNPDSK